MNKTKKAIVKGAINVFSKAGYNGATMDEVALVAGVAKGTLYYYFKSKEEIFNFIMDQGLELLGCEIRKVNDLKLNPLSKLKEICKIQLTILYENTEFFKVLISQIWGQEGRQLELRGKLEKYLEIIEIYIKQAIEDGSIKKGNSKFLAHTFFGTLISAAIYEVAYIEKIDLESIIENLIEVSFYGLQTKN